MYLSWSWQLLATYSDIQRLCGQLCFNPKIFYKIYTKLIEIHILILALNVPTQLFVFFSIICYELLNYLLRASQLSVTSRNGISKKSFLSLNKLHCEFLFLVCKRKITRRKVILHMNEIPLLLITCSISADIADVSFELFVLFEHANKEWISKTNSEASF
jgi:hypothetical protein